MTQPLTVLAFDYGRLRIGVAVGERLTASARPLRILATRNGQADWDAITHLINEWQPGQLVVGVPWHADGTASSSTGPAQRFAHELGRRFVLPVARIDEHLSSYEARERLSQQRGGRRPAAGTLDAAAAALILESWFHHQQG